MSAEVLDSWLDNHHPAQYGLTPWPRPGEEPLTGTELKKWDGDPRIERFDRCPTCEEWAPCRVREAYNLLASIQVGPHGHIGLSRRTTVPPRRGPAAIGGICPVCAPILELLDRDTKEMVEGG